MPFIQRIVEPKFLSRTSLQNENGDPIVTDCELEAVTNNTLSNALRQLASLVLVANDIFTELTKELQKVSDRSASLKVKIGLVEDKLSGYDPKTVTVPEGDISSFALLRNHFERKQTLDTGLFHVETRPSALHALYEAAAKTPVHAMRQMDRWRRDGHRSSRFFLCTPVLGAKRRKIRSRVDIDIETRVPAVVGELRRWTSSEAIGDVTVTPDCINRITSNTTGTSTVTATEETDIIDGGATSGDDEGIDHKLPSPEEQLQVLALKFPAEIVAVDVSGRRFDRMSVQRRSLLHTETTYVEEDEGGSTVRRRTRTRKPRGKRRNTLAGTDQKEIVDALAAGDTPTPATLHGEPESPDNGAVMRSRSTDILRSKKGSPSDGKKSHFNSLKQWGKSRLKLMNRSTETKATVEAAKVEDIDDVNIYETVTMRRRKNVDKNTKSTHERKTSYSSSEKSSSISLPISTPISAAMNIAVKLRESSAQRRQRRNKDEQHSSSGNWSASSESGRASIGSEITSTTITTHPKSTTPTTTSTNSLNQHGPPSSTNSRRRFPNTSTSSSVTSEGTLTPDIIHDIQDDGETSSVYSCDTEGYYTSFHMDSGLKTLKEEDLNIPMTPLHTTSAFSNSSGNSTVLTAENEYELFGKGSTSTTTSSAGTVCTTLRAAESNRSVMVGPAVPERKSSLSKLDAERSTNNSLEREFSSDKTGTVKRSPATNKAVVVAVVHKQSAGDVSPDSGHNTSSSPIESINSPNGVPSCSEFEFSESSDLEGVERIERIRIKTTINSSRIPSMCVITPPHSDDESVQSVQNFEYAIPHKYKLSKDKEPTADNTSTNNLNIPDLGSKNAANRQKLNLPLAPTETDLDTLTFTDSENKDCDSSKKSRVILTSINGSNKMQLINVNPSSGYATVDNVDSKISTNGELKNPVSNAKASSGIRAPSPSGGSVTIKETAAETKSPPSQPILKATLLPLNNMFGKLRTNLSNLTSKKEKTSIKYSPNTDDLFDSGDYVTIADVRNNNEKTSMNTEVLYANDVVKKDNKPSANTQSRNTEYISLNELPNKQQQQHETHSGNRNESNSLEQSRRQGARVTLDSEGKVVYSSDSLKRRKGAHTTFEPGPFVKNISTPSTSPLPTHRTPRTVRPVISNSNTQDINDKSTVAVNHPPPVVLKYPAPVQSPTAQPPEHPPADASLRPLSPQLNKVVIRANPKTSSGLTSPTADCVRMPPATIVTPTARPMSPKLPNAKGAYVHMQEDRGRSLSPAHEEERALSPYKNQNMHPQPVDQYYHRGFPMEYQQQNDGFMVHRNSPLYRTLPSRMIYRNTQEERSQTPDFTRDINSQYNISKQCSNNMFDNKQNYGFNSLPRKQQMFNYHVEQQKQLPSYQQTVTVPQTQSFHKQNQVPLNVEANTRNVQNFHYSTPKRNDSNVQTSKIPMGISNFFSPIPKSVEPAQKYHNESMKISPIDPRNTGSFKSSTPARPKEVNSAVNLSSKLLSPKKSTMTNDELYAMIHKSKKKLNIRTEDVDRNSPVPSVASLSPCNSIQSLSGRSTPVKQPETGYIVDARNRNSWSPNNDNSNVVGKVLSAEAGSRQSWACSDRIGPKQTSRLDFKKLLLQHGSKSNVIPNSNNKISAVEQLKLTKNQPVPAKQAPQMNILDLSSSPRSLVNRKLPNVLPGSPNKTPEKQRPVSKLMSPRSNWRFANPRSDVLSSTILEDCREDESPNSSLEKSNAWKKSPKLHDNRYSVQNSITQCNTHVAAENVMQKPDSVQFNTSENNNVKNARSSMMRSQQLLQSQRAEFFKSTRPNTAATYLPSEGRQKTPSSTLETAL